MIGYEVFFQTRDKSLSQDIPKEFRPHNDRDDEGNIFADLVKPMGGGAKMVRKTKRVLNVGGNNKDILLPTHYKGWEHILLDLDLSGNPDIHMDAVDIISLEPSQFDAVYCSHNLEHFYRADVVEVLKGIHHVLKDDGFTEILVPDIEQLIKVAYEKNLDIDDVLYEVPDFGPITVHDYIFGYEFSNDPIGRELCLHKTAFTQKSLEGYLKSSGFPLVFSRVEDMQIHMLGFKKKPTRYIKTSLGIGE